MNETERGIYLFRVRKLLRLTCEGWPEALRMDQIGRLVSPTCRKPIDPWHNLWRFLNDAVGSGALRMDGPPVEPSGISLTGWARGVNTRRQDSFRYNVGITRRLDHSPEWSNEFAPQPTPWNPPEAPPKLTPTVTARTLAALLHGRDLPELLAAWLAPWMEGKGQAKRRSSKLPASAKQDDLALELDPILHALRETGELLNSVNVMPKLQARAGRKDSCITEKLPKGILWVRGSTGQPEKLEGRALNERIRRWENSQAAR